MSHNAELSRRMAQARISVCHSRRCDDTHFHRREPEPLRRLEFDDGRPLFEHQMRLRLLCAAAFVGLFAAALVLAAGFAELVLRWWP